jgi:hypothetical protein
MDSGSLLRDDTAGFPAKSGIPFLYDRPQEAGNPQALYGRSFPAGKTRWD